MSEILLLKATNLWEDYRAAHPKVQFYKTIKELERSLQASGADKNIKLHAFLVSETKSAVLESQWDEYDGAPVTRERMESWNILFPDEDQLYVKKLFENVLQA